MLPFHSLPMAMAAIAADIFDFDAMRALEMRAFWPPSLIMLVSRRRGEMMPPASAAGDGFISPVDVTISAGRRREMAPIIAISIDGRHYRSRLFDFYYRDEITALPRRRRLVGFLPMGLMIVESWLIAFDRFDDRLLTRCAPRRRDYKCD